MTCSARMLDQRVTKPRPGVVCSRRSGQTRRSSSRHMSRNPRSPPLQPHSRAPSHHRAVGALSADHGCTRGFKRDGTPRARSPLLVDVGVHSSERVMSPASRVESHDLVVWLRTGVSSGNRPTNVLKSRKYHAHR